MFVTEESVRPQVATLLGPNFEDGADGVAPATPATSDLCAEGTAKGFFSGTLHVTGGRVLLAAGGVQIEVLASDSLPADDDSLRRERERAAARFQPWNDKGVSLRGEQRGVYIIRAAPAVEVVRAATLFDGEARRKFDQVDEAIRARGDELRRIPGVISVRPGYRFVDGWITDEPAIVVTVLRKRERSYVSADEAVPEHVGHVRVDVAPATPLEQLRAGAEAAQTSPVVLPEAAAESGYAFPDWERGAESEPSEAVGSVTEALSDIRYEPPPGVELAEVTDAMTVICHVSPDAGWPTLRDFFGRTVERMTVAMYDFTAPHILRNLRSAMSQASGELRLILGPHEALPAAASTDSTKADDLPERTVIRRLSDALRRRFQSAWAVVGNPRGIFANSYHIKVAVRDGRSFWLSSGNWQSSNQPDLDPLGADANVPNILKDYNREWHVIVHHPALAEVFEKFIEWDIEQARQSEAAPGSAAERAMPDLLVPAETAEFGVEAEEAESVPRYFAPAHFSFTSRRPLRVQPLLTPDNYADHILPLIESAREKLYFQNQSIGFAQHNYRKFTALVDALRGKIDEGLDVRIILRGDFGPRAMLEALKARGFKQAHIKFQRNCHTKGILVDSKIAVVSSHNWTNSGTLFNRDAGLIFYDTRIARYYEGIFLHDWDNLARHRVAEEMAMPVLAGGQETIPPGMLRVPWDVYYED